MVAPESQHLYVMQNEFGAIKIGRSLQPEIRRGQLQQSEDCQIEIIAIYSNCGHDEEDLHITLSDYRIEGEWFDGTSAAREAIQEIFSLAPTEWKYPLDADRLHSWRERMRQSRRTNYIYRQFSREIGVLRSQDGGHHVLDGSIFWCLYLAKTGMEPRTGSIDGPDGRAAAWFNPHTSSLEALPRYTSEIDAALLVWPEDIRPSTWAGSPIECCIAGLTAFRSRLPRK